MTINDIIAIGRQIAAETAEGGNTAARVGGVIEAIGEILKSQDYMSWQPAGNFDIETLYEKDNQATFLCRRTTSATPSTRTTSHTRKAGG